MNISIIICTHNRAHFLKDALQSLMNMKVSTECNVELLVVNNASSDGTTSVINEFFGNSKGFYVKSIFEPRLGKTYALNKAIRDASGEILAFVDDDHIVSDGYLDAFCKIAKENPSFGLFCGRILPNWDGTEPQWVHDNTLYPIRPFPVPCFDLGNKAIEVREGMFTPGAGNLFIRKYVFQTVGPFSEMLGPKGHNLNGGEDIEFIKRALRSGEKLLYVPEALQYHQVDKSKLTLSYLIKKAYFRSLSAYQFLELTSNHCIGNVPVYLFGHAVNRFIKALFTLNKDTRRFYLVRFAATIGEIHGRLKSKAVQAQI